MNSGLKARAPGGAIAGPGKANHYHGDLWPRNQVKERCEIATVPTETRHFTSSHSLAMQPSGVKGGKQAPARQQQQETGFFCLDAFGKATAVHRICGRAGIYGQAQDTQANNGRNVCRQRSEHGGIVLPFLEITGPSWDESTCVGLEHSSTRPHETGLYESGYTHCCEHNRHA